MKAAIFDVDGTLLDSMGMWDDIGARYLKSIRVEPEDNLKEVLFLMSMAEGTRYIREHYHLSQSIPEIMQGVMDVVKDFYDKEASLKPGVREFLSKLSDRGIPMVAATASDREHIESAFDRLGIRRYFKKVFTCDEAGASKTEPVIYQMAAEYLGVQPSEAYVFEDVLYAILTAKRAGFRTVGVFDQYSAKDQEEIKKQSDFYLSSFSTFMTFQTRSGRRSVQTKK